MQRQEPLKKIYKENMQTKLITDHAHPASVRTLVYRRRAVDCQDEPLDLWVAPEGLASPVGDVAGDFASRKRARAEEVSVAKVASSTACFQS
eukprot:1875803-Amphidinium_carterae.1